MTDDLEHLAPAHRAHAELAVADRVRLVRTDRWISYPRAELSLSRLEDLLDYPPRDRMPCLLLHGATGMGKTKIVRKFVRDHPAEFNQRTGITRQPVVFLQMPPHPDEKIFFQEILNALGAPARGTASAQELQRVSRDLLMHMGARMLIIDEVHALLAGTFRQQRILLNTLRFLATDLRIPLVCVGTADARRALMTDQQLADRFEAIELPRWSDEVGFQRLLASYAAVFPLRKRSNLIVPPVRQKILDLTNGVFVRIARLLETLAVEAILSGHERIDAESFTRMSTPPLLSMTRLADALTDPR